ncbi:MAG: hypothetical protein ACLVEJ_12380 [Parabacteroides sp.]
MPDSATISIIVKPEPACEDRTFAISICYNISVEDHASCSRLTFSDFHPTEFRQIQRLRQHNHGVDVTLEQYMTNGFYYMLTGSLFKSKYKGGDDIWRNTRRWTEASLNVLAVESEWMVGKQKQNIA